MPFSKTDLFPFFFSLVDSAHYNNKEKKQDNHAMYTLLHGLYNYLTRKEEFYVLIIGLDNAGKTVRR